MVYLYDLFVLVKVVINVGRLVKNNLLFIIIWGKNYIFSKN